MCVCFGLVGSRPGPVTAAALYAMMGRAAAAGGDGSYSSRSARRGAGGGAAGRGESVRQRGGMGRASVPGPSMAAERGGAGRGVARPPATCEAARRGGAGEVEERASPLRARPSATPHASVGPAAHVRQRSARPSAAVVTRQTDRWPGPGTVARWTVGRCGWRSCLHRPPAARVHWNARVRQPLCTILRRLYRANLLARVCRARSASVCAAVRTSHVNMRCPKRQARLVSERLIHKLAGLTALRPSQHCITNLIDVEMTGRTSTKVTQFLIQRWKIVNDSVF